MSQVPPPGPGPQTVRPHRGTLILVLGILGIIAWALGYSDLQAMKRGEMDRSGEGLTRAGMICGIVSVAMTALSVLYTIIWGWPQIPTGTP